MTARALGAACAAGLALAAIPATAGAGHDGCSASVTEPSLAYGVFVITSSSVDCASPKNTIRITQVLTTDGIEAARSERTCHKRVDCWTYVTRDDPAGDQVWCTTLTARVGSHTLPAVTRCEADGF